MNEVNYDKQWNDAWNSFKDDSANFCKQLANMCGNKETFESLKKVLPKYIIDGLEVIIAKSKVEEAACFEMMKNW